jgi:hypothetical protein
MAIQNTQLTTVASPIYTSSGNSASTVMHICNYGGSGSVTANVFLVPNGMTANNYTIIYSAVTLTSNNTLVVDTEKIIFANGDAIYANVSANNAVTATVSYIGI